MLTSIEQHLTEIEREYDVRILFAAESGSRAWGFSSPDSDWDVRFVYAHPLEWYLTIEEDRDVIEVLTDDGFDAVGWDIRKALQLYRKTNPSMLEWFGSPIIYKDDGILRKALQSLLPYFFNKTRALYHYYHIATNHQSRYLEKRGVKLKRYFYFLRALLACKWLMEKNTPPPAPFEELVNSEVSDRTVRQEINHILALKRTSREHDKETVNEVLYTYGQQLEEEVERFLGAYNPTKTIKNDMDKELNRLLYNIIVKNERYDTESDYGDACSCKVMAHGG